MTVSNYLLYLAAVALLVITPGPTMLMCVTNAISHGAGRALASACGALTASLGVMALSALGLGAVLAASATAFTVLKVAGAAYLIWLGIRTMRGSHSAVTPGSTRGRWRWQRRSVGEGQRPRVEPGVTASSDIAAMFTQGLMVGASNPKAIIFFAAFFPQFIAPESPMLPQFLLLSLTFVVLDFLMLVACAFGVGRVAPRLRQAHVVRWINRVCGGLFTLLGGLLLFSRRST